MTNTNRTAVAATIAALRQDGRLRPEHASLVTLAESLAEGLDRALSGPDARLYVADRLSRSLHLVLLSLLGLPAAQRPNPIDAIGRELARTLEVGPDS